MGLSGRPVADPGMPPAPIVEDFDVFEQCRLPPGTELCSMNKLRFERAEERLHRRVVIAVTLAAHGGFDAVAVEDLAIRSAGVLDAAIGMVDEALGRRAMPDRHHQGVLAQRTPQMMLQPTISRVAMSLMAARYNQPSSVATYVISVNQIVFG